MDKRPTLHPGGKSRDFRRLDLLERDIDRVLIPLSAYLLIPDTQSALQLSVVVTLISLAVFGGVKGLFTGVPLIRSSFQTTVIGGLAAAAAFGIARWIG